MMITERDMKMLRFINRFNFSKRKTLQEIYFGHNSKKGATQAINKRLLGLVRGGFLNSDKDLRSRSNVYFLTKKGADFLQSYGIPANSYQALSWSTYIHNDTAQKVLVEFFKQGHRRFLSEKDYKAFAKSGGVIPDLVLIHDDNTFSYIEIELEEKTKARYLERLNQFELDPNMRHLIYLCSMERVALKIARLHKDNELNHSLYSLNIEHFLKNPTYFIGEIRHGDQ